MLGIQAASVFDPVFLFVIKDMLNIKSAKTKKIALLALFVFLLLLVLLTASLFLKPSKQKKLPKDESAEITHPFPDKLYEHHPITEERCKLQENELAKEACFEELKYLNATINLNVQECGELADEKKRDDCHSYIAGVIPDGNICEKIKDKTKKEMCAVRAAINIGVYENDMQKGRNVCDKYFTNEPFENQECKDKVMVFVISGNIKDIKLCHEVRTLEYPALCYDYMFGQGYDCSGLSKENGKDKCESMYFLNKAKSLEDCYKLPLEDYKKVCLARIENKLTGPMDSDNDGVTDGEELNYGVSPFNPDTDNDGLDDYEEMKAFRTDPTRSDTDGDNLSDFDEIKKYKSSPQKQDTDHDGLKDWDEVFVYKTDINNPDTDNDGYLDGEEVVNGYNPLGEGKLKQ